MDIRPAVRRAHHGSNRAGTERHGDPLPVGVISARPAHPALVSEADFIAAQDIRAPRGNPDPSRCHRLAGLLRCGACGPRMGPCWANNRAACRCRHGHTSASATHPDRPKNLYIREDHVLPHLSALGVLLAGPDPALSTTELIDRMRTREITWTYGPEDHTLRTSAPEEVKITVDDRH